MHSLLRPIEEVLAEYDSCDC